MDFTIKNLDESIVSVARKIGYVIIDTKGNGEYNLVRKLDIGNYPRFHAYVTQSRSLHNRGSSTKSGQGNNYNFGLHLDQKQPSYQGSHAHSGEYFGPVVDTEADRIEEILEK